MSLRRARAGIVLALLCLAASLSGPATSSAHYYVFSDDHYFDDCDNTWEPDYQAIAHTYKGSPTSGNNIFGARATATIENLKACFAPSSLSVVGLSAVFAANIEGYPDGNPSGTDFGHVQLGYGITNCPSGYSTCSNGLPDNALRFLWTDSDLTPGWYGVVPGAPVPQVGVKYRFTVEWTVDEWQFEIRNQDTGTVVWSDSVTNHWADGGYRAWSGAEIINSASMFNRKSSDALHYISNVKYSPPTGGWLSFPQNGCHYAVQSIGDDEPSSAWSQCTQSTDVDGDVRINPYTNLHNSY